MFKRLFTSSKPQASKAASAGAGSIPPFEPYGSFDWQILHRPPRKTYGDNANPDVINLLRFPPRFALEVGCNAGVLGQFIKEQYPDARVWGVEPNPVTAKAALARLDKVLVQPVEEVDWSAQGVQPGQIDTVFLFDVLEHIYDPWKTLLTLRSLVSDTAQLVVSIPNVRNLFLLQDLVNGHWRYREMGLLDITHIRFFTDQDLMRMFYQTGFRVMNRSLTLDGNSRSVFENLTGKEFPQRIELDSWAITVKSEADLVSLCAMQHVFNLAPARYEYLSPEERSWIDEPHPPTQAYAGVPAA